jgi:hypothetical protein
LVAQTLVRSRSKLATSGLCKRGVRLAAEDGTLRHTSKTGWLVLAFWLKASINITICCRFSGEAAQSSKRF